MKLRDVQIITQFEITRILRSAQGILFLCFFVMVYGWICSKLFDVNTELNQAMSMVNAAGSSASPEAMMGVTAFLEFLGWFTGLPADSLASLMKSAPPLLVAFSFLALVFAPLLSLFGAFDQTAGDIGNKHIRYLLIRTDRTSLYVGKTLGTWLVIVMANLLISLVVMVMAVVGGASLGETLPYTLRIFVVLSFFALPFVTLMGFANAFTGHGFLSLLVAVGYYFFVWAASGIGSWTKSKMEYVAYLFPTAFKFQLLSHNWGDVFVAVGQQLACALAFFALGLLIFRRRDL